MHRSLLCVLDKPKAFCYRPLTMPNITLNGQEHVLERSKSIADLLRELKVPAGGLAVAVNDEIVSRDEHGSRLICGGDRVEIIRAIGGG